ncbi:11733_t:CDS:2 [Entrophospora sp. SA101]|nr:10480_t:CDS:2 [Entrophospora sp. SA101]CAJ0843954.1 11733_t:CDS:2 [Entrophospora sp. SA101]
MKNNDTFLLGNKILGSNPISFWSNMIVHIRKKSFPRFKDIIEKTILYNDIRLKLDEV